MSITINPPAGPWTTDDIEQLSEDARVEIHEGNLVLMAPVELWHSRMMVRIKIALAAQGLPADIEVGVKRSSKDFRIADVAVFHRPQSNPDQAYWRPDEIAVAIEVVSDSSEADDRVVKPRWYAAEGVPEFWRVERTEDDADALIFQYKLVRTADGQPAGYIESGMTTVSALEQGL